MPASAMRGARGVRFSCVGPFNVRAPLRPLASCRTACGRHGRDPCGRGARRVRTDRHCGRSWRRWGSRQPPRGDRRVGAGRRLSGLSRRVVHHRRCERGGRRRRDAEQPSRVQVRYLNARQDELPGAFRCDMWLNSITLLRSRIRLTTDFLTRLDTGVPVRMDGGTRCRRGHAAASIRTMPGRTRHAEHPNE